MPLKVKHVHLKLNEFKMIFFCQKSSYSILKMYGSALKHKFNSVPGSDCNECILTIDFFAVCVRFALLLAQLASLELERHATKEKAAAI